MKTQKTKYYYSGSGQFGRYYAKGNVKPYGSIWKVTEYSIHSYASGYRREWDGEPECVFCNVAGLDDPCIPKRIRVRLIEH